MPNPPISAMPAMISSGMSVLARWMCSARGPDLVLGEPVEGLPHQLEVGVEVTVAFGVGQGGQEGRVVEGGHEPLDRCHPPGGCAPQVAPAHQSGGQVGQGIGGEGAGDPGLGVAMGPVGQQCLGGSHRRGGVGDVVGQHLGRRPARRLRSGRRSRRRPPTGPRPGPRRRPAGLGRERGRGSRAKVTGPGSGCLSAGRPVQVPAVAAMAVGAATRRRVVLPREVAVDHLGDQVLSPAGPGPPP